MMYGCCDEITQWNGYICHTVRIVLRDRNAEQVLCSEEGSESHVVRFVQS